MFPTSYFTGKFERWKNVSDKVSTDRGSEELPTIGENLYSKSIFLENREEIVLRTLRHVSQKILILMKIYVHFLDV